MTKEEEALIAGIEYALNLAVGASERGYTLGEILIAIRVALNKTKQKYGLTEVK